MEVNILHHHLCSFSSPTPFLVLNPTSPCTTQISLRPAFGRCPSLKATRPTINNSSSSSSSNSGEDGNTLPSIPETPADTVEIRFRRGSRRKTRELDASSGSGSGSGSSSKRHSPPKDWESMTFGEKVMELYVGEKGLLFWLNKLAYASIFIIIGAWILFRFVGPSLGFYELDTPPLSPSKVLSG